MDANTKKLLVRAAKGLRLNDIALFQARFDRPTPDTGDIHGEASQQHKRSVSYTVGSISSDAPDETRLLQVRVSLGTRVVQRVDGGEPQPLFVIEADYLVEYAIQGDVPEDAIKAFAEFNAIHNVWPFWRQHVFNIVEQGRLPHLEVPLFEGAHL